ncbi:putative Rho GTPase-activating protein 39 [Blattamonas nauphoetae]|uniref:Rho GTPase-activating protein 39 n=1 Tax=Blattamonas nauphoetae TaxID=2049346 RepID=A0ABQ9XTI3_9EUKA|nr:putative Rho GTPase-activating protein 39 [Blattamonas nauphoetae]
MNLPSMEPKWTAPLPPPVPSLSVSEEDTQSNTPSIPSPPPLDAIPVIEVNKRPRFDPRQFRLSTVNQNSFLPPPISPPHDSDDLFSLPPPPPPDDPILPPPEPPFDSTRQSLDQPLPTPEIPAPFIPPPREMSSSPPPPPIEDNGYTLTTNDDLPPPPLFGSSGRGAPRIKASNPLEARRTTSVRYGQPFVPGLHPTLPKVTPNAPQSLLEVSSAQGSGVVLHHLPRDVQTQIIQFSLEGFAEQHFTNQKKGIFHRNAPSASELLTFSTKPVVPILKSTPVDREKDARRLFRDILKWMGVIRAKKELLFYTKRLIKLGEVDPSLRDEIYMQLLRMTNPPTPASLQHAPKDQPKYTFAMCESAWILISMCCDAFLPSQDFEMTLLAYFKNTIEHQSKFPDFTTDQMEIIRTHAEYALNTLYALTVQGGRKKGRKKDEVEERVNQQTVEQIRQIKESRAVYNRALSSLMWMQSRINRNPATPPEPPPSVYSPIATIPATSIPDSPPLSLASLQIPYVILFLIQKIKQGHGEKAEGIFRQCIPVNTMEKNLKQIDRGEYNVEYRGEDPHIFAVLIKQWFSQMPTTIIPSKLYSQIIQLVNWKDDQNRDSLPRTALNQRSGSLYTFDLADLRSMGEESQTDIISASSILPKETTPLQRFMQIPVLGETMPENYALFVEAHCPTVNVLILKYLFRFLRTLILPENSNTNKMDLNALSICISPCLIKTNSDDPKEIMKHLNDERQFIVGLIENLTPTLHEEELFQWYERDWEQLGREWLKK